MCWGLGYNRGKQMVIMKRITIILSLLLFSNFMFSQVKDATEELLRDYELYSHKYTYADILILQDSSYFPIHLRASFECEEDCPLDKTNIDSFIRSVYENAKYTYLPLIYNAYVSVYGKDIEVFKAAYDAENLLGSSFRSVQTTSHFKLDSGEQVIAYYYDILGLFYKVKSNELLYAFSSNDTFEYWKCNEIKEIIVPFRPISITKTKAIFW